MKLNISALSDTGTVRPRNEDHFGVFEKEGLIVICDGIGGHKAGDAASRLAVETFKKFYTELDPEIHQEVTKDLKNNALKCVSKIVSACRLTNRRLYNLGHQEIRYRGMGTTLTAIEFDDDKAIIAHIGDSRVYKIQNNEMRMLTVDHTWINELIQDKEIDPKDADKFIKKNVITRAMGLEAAIKIDVHIEPIERDDKFLLCTDGLSKALTNDEIKNIIFYNGKNLDHALRHLVDNANIKDGSDNITAILAHVEKINRSAKKRAQKSIILKPENKHISDVINKIVKHESTSNSAKRTWFNKLFKRK